MTSEGTPERREPLATSVTKSLVSRFLGGNPEAADRLVEKLERALRPAIRFHPLFPALKGSLSEDDVLNELWKAVLERDSFERFQDRGRGSLRTYLRGALDRVMTDLARRAGAAKRGGGELPRSLDGSSSTARRAGAVAAEGPGPSTVASAGELAERCLRALPEREAQVWELRVIQELEFDEIGRRLGCTAASARGLLHRARARLVDAGILEEEAGDGGA